jgi:hypothetical protein
MMDAVSLAWAVMLAVAGLALVACKATVAWRRCIEAGLKGLPKGQTSGGTAGLRRTGERWAQPEPRREASRTDTTKMVRLAVERKSLPACCGRA